MTTKPINEPGFRGYEKDGLISGYDYHRQAWVKDGRYVSCDHPYRCKCYGKLNAGKPFKLAEGGTR